MATRQVGSGLRFLNPLTRSHLTPRRLPPRWLSLQGTRRAWESTAAGTEEKKSGHIKTAPNESILWFDNLFPLKLSGFLRVLWQGSGYDVRALWQGPETDVEGLVKRFESSNLGVMDPINMVKLGLPSDSPVKVTEIVPRLKDGGAFVKFSHPPDITREEIERKVAKLLAEKPIRPIFSPFRRVHASLVKGVPWLEDLQRFPKNRLRIEFVPKNPGEEAVELSQEILYSMFRRYGTIADIVSQPWDSKVIPKYAYVDFGLVRDAIMARNCLHGFVVSEAQGGGSFGTKFRISYEEKPKHYRFWDWVTNHPRIVIPVLVAFLTAATVVIFDPIRLFFVEAHISRKYQLNNNKWYRWLRKQTSDIFSFSREKAEQAGLDTVWSHRKYAIEQIQTWLMETAETFIVVQGSRGSGKRQLVLEQALKDRTNVLVIDCKQIVEAKGESTIIKKLAEQVGYRPIFSWANSLSSMVDLAIQSTTGVKAGFSETLDSQLQKVLETTAEALQDLALENRSKDDSDASLSVDTYLDVHPEKRPVVVLDNFVYKTEDNALVYEKIATWAAGLIQSDIAHVIILVNDSSYSKVLSKALPDRVFRTVALGDLSPDVAKRFILSHISTNTTTNESTEASDDSKKEVSTTPLNLTELDECIGILGGRLTDLEYLARRIKAGQSPKQAIAEIIEQSASEILKMFLLAGKMTGDGEHKWSTEQAWYLVKALAERDVLRYNEVLIADTFTYSLSAPDGESALEGLANAELITIRTGAGRPHSIIVGKPVYQAAFRQLVADRVLAAKMDLVLLKELVKIEAGQIQKAENELVQLGVLPGLPYETHERTRYLLARIAKAQGRIGQYEREMGGLKKVLGSEY